MNVVLCVLCSCVLIQNPLSCTSLLHLVLVSFSLARAFNICLKIFEFGQKMAKSLKKNIIKILKNMAKKFEKKVKL